MIEINKFDAEEWESFSDKQKLAAAKIMFQAYNYQSLQNMELLAALSNLACVAKEAMSLCQTQRGMMFQGMAKDIGKPLLSAVRLIEREGGKVAC